MPPGVLDLREGSIMPLHLHSGSVEVRRALLDAVILATGSAATYLLVTDVLSRLYFISKTDDLIGALWAVISFIVVNRGSYRSSVVAGVSRMVGTSVSFLLCLLYLAFLPFHVWALAVLVGAGGLVVTLAGRPQDAGIAAIATTVIMVVAAVNPHDAWKQPILRLADTAIGVAIGVATAWIGSHFIPPDVTSSASTLGGPAAVKKESGSPKGA
jgi:hypothetical protein